MQIALRVDRNGGRAPQSNSNTVCVSLAPYVKTAGSTAMTGQMSTYAQVASNLYITSHNEEIWSLKSDATLTLTVGVFEK